MGIKTTIRRLLRGAATESEGSASRPVEEVSPEESIPRYPPIPEGTPAVGVDEILDSQHRLIIRVKEEVGLPPDMEAEYVDPVIRAYASYVHLLPASASHHHRGAGGLVRHGLEAAMWATQALRGRLIVMGRDLSPEQRYFEEPKWRYACLIASLCHDIGKIVTDMRVVTENREKTWSPYQAPLAEWLKKAKVKRYWVNWEEDRHKVHETVGVGFIERLVPESAYDWLHGERGQFIALLHRYLSGSEPRERDRDFYECIEWGDRTSVKRDLEAQMLVAGNERQEVPVAQYVMDAMHRLLVDRRWPINEPGARVWVGEGGEDETYLLWPEGINEAVQLLRQDEIPGIPGDPQVVAKLLWDRFALGDLGEEEEELKRGMEEEPPQKLSIAPEMLRGEDGELTWLSVVQLNPYSIGVPDNTPGVKLQHPADSSVSDTDSGEGVPGETEGMEQGMERPMDPPMERPAESVGQGGVPSGDPSHGTAEKMENNQSVPMEQLDGTEGGGVPVPGSMEQVGEEAETEAAEASRRADGTPADGTPAQSGTPHGTTDGTLPDLSDLDEVSRALVEAAARAGWSAGRREWAVSLEVLASEPDEKPLKTVQPYQALLEPDPERPMSVIRRGNESGKYVVLQRRLGKRAEELAAAMAAGEADSGSAQKTEEPTAEPSQEESTGSAADAKPTPPAETISKLDEAATPPGAAEDAGPAEEDRGPEPAGSPSSGRAAARDDSEEAALIEQLGEAFQEWVNEQASLGSSEKPSWIVPGAHAHWVAQQEAAKAFFADQKEALQEKVGSARKLIGRLEQGSVVEVPAEVPPDVRAILRGWGHVRMVKRG